jgi:acyl-CoA thioester hydrolase
VEKEGARYVFYQDILRQPDHKLVMRAKVDIVCLVNGKLVVGIPEFDNILR